MKVEILARQLDVTKGCFYWHFKNRDGLLRGIVDWWRGNQIDFLKDLDEQRLDDPTGLIKSVIGSTHHTDDSRHDIAMREFARFEGSAVAKSINDGAIICRRSFRRQNSMLQSRR